MTQNILRLLAGLAGTCLLSFAAVLPASSSLSGLNPGDTYHFVFVTSGTTTANNNTLAYYNNFVQTAADNASIGSGIGATWRAIVSVGGGASNAANNAPVSATAKVFLLDGSMVANGTTNPFYTEATDHLVAINLTELMTTLAAGQLVWTGGNASGSESGSGLVGGGSPVYGDANGILGCRCTGGWARVSNGSSSTANHIYGVSQAFTASASSVPEPSTLGVSALALGALLTLRRRR